MMRLSLATAVGILAMSQSGVASAATVNEAYADSWIASEFRAKSQQITLTGVEGNDGPSTTISKVNIDGSFEQFRDGELSLVSDGNKVFELGSDGKWNGRLGVTRQGARYVCPLLAAVRNAEGLIRHSRELRMAVGMAVMTADELMETDSIQ